MFFENLKLAIESLKGNKLRTTLSLLGIVIGVSAVIIIMTLGKSATSDIQKQIASMGMRKITVQLRGPRREMEQFKPVLTHTIKKEVPGILNALPQAEKAGVIARSLHSINVGTLIGTQKSFDTIHKYEVDAGRFISREDNEKRRMVVVLGNEIAWKLFPEGGAIGKTIRILEGTRPNLKVIGIMKQKDNWGINLDKTLYIPFSTMFHKFYPVPYVNSYLFETEEGAEPIEVSENLKSWFQKRINNFWLQSPSAIAEEYKDVTRTISLLMGSIAAISLLVGGIGIMNIMLVSVTERTREIGIRKALGATPVLIRTQFLTEAVNITVTGGILGILWGSLVSYIIVHFLKWTFTPDPSSYVISVLFSSFVGIFFGLYPAVKASRMDPVKALSYE